MLEIKDNGTFKNARMNSLNNQGLEDLESLEYMKKKEKRSHSKITIKSFETRLEEANKNSKIKKTTDFNENNYNSTNLLLSEKSTIKITTRFMNGKILMFSKVLLQSFVCDVIDVFSFPRS